MLYFLVVSGVPFWSSSGSGGLDVLGMVVAPSDHLRGAWVTSGELVRLVGCPERRCIWILSYIC